MNLVYLLFAHFAGKAAAGIIADTRPSGPRKYLLRSQETRLGLKMIWMVYSSKRRYYGTIIHASLALNGLGEHMAQLHRLSLSTRRSGRSNYQKTPTTIALLLLVRTIA